MNLPGSDAIKLYAFPKKNNSGGPGNCAIILPVLPYRKVAYLKEQ